MRKILILAVGDLKDAWLKEGCAEFEKRLRPYGEVAVREVRESRLEGPAAVEEEGKALLPLIPPNALTVALCIEGKPLSSEEFARRLDRAATEGRGDLCFLIGGSWGLSEAVKARAHLRLSFSPMTFPHRLARLMLLEQLYRAFAILAGKPYHK